MPLYDGSRKSYSMTHSRAGTVGGLRGPQNFLKFARSRIDFEKVVALGVLSAIVAVQLLLTRYWLDLIDEGYFAELADRVTRGELPIATFQPSTRPASIICTPGRSDCSGGTW